MIECGNLLNRVEAIAREAGASIMAIYARQFTVQEKDDRSPLTEADTAAHTIITERLSQLDPRLPILSEEAVGDFVATAAPARYWLVDPLDGTKEFIKRNGEFTVNIALIADGKPVMGVVYAPAFKVAYVAAEGRGTVKVSAAGDRVLIRVAERVEGAPWRIVGSRSHAGDSLAALVKQLGPHEMVSMGSSLKFCLVAEGAADVYPRLGPTSLWDTAAAQCVVEQAGGRVIELTGAALSYGVPAVILNPFFIVHGVSTIDWPDLLRTAGIGSV